MLRINKLLIFALLTCLLLSLGNCGVSKSETPRKPAASESVVSYQKDLKPIMIRSCTPCHFPENGQKEMLDTYERTREYIGEIVFRIQLPPEEIKYMPFKSKRPALTAAEINLFKQWARTGMAE